MFEEKKGEKPVPERYTASATPAMTGGGDSGSGGSGSGAAQEEEEIDPYELVEAVNILPKIGNDWFDNIVR